MSRDIRRDCREAQVTLELHKDGLIMCYNGAGLSHGSLSASHPIYEGGMGSRK